MAHWFEREDNLSSPDRYALHLVIYHGHHAPLSGRYIVRAFGDVFGKGGRKAPGGENYAFGDVTDAAPGRSDGFKCKFYINNPDLRTNDLPIEKVKSTATLTFLVNFEPAPKETDWKLTAWHFGIEKGKINQNAMRDQILSDELSEAFRKN